MPTEDELIAEVERIAAVMSDPRDRIEVTTTRYVRPAFGSERTFTEYEASVVAYHENHELAYRGHGKSAHERVDALRNLLTAMREKAAEQLAEARAKADRLAGVVG